MLEQLFRLAGVFICVSSNLKGPNGARLARTHRKTKLLHFACFAGNGIRRGFAWWIIYGRSDDRHRISMESGWTWANAPVDAVDGHCLSNAVALFARGFCVEMYTRTHTHISSLLRAWDEDGNWTIIHWNRWTPVDQANNSLEKAVALLFAHSFFHYQTMRS